MQTIHACSFIEEPCCAPPSPRLLPLRDGPRPAAERGPAQSSEAWVERRVKSGITDKAAGRARAFVPPSLHSQPTPTASDGKWKQSLSGAKLLRYHRHRYGTPASGNMEVNWEIVKKLIRAIHKALKKEHHFKFLSKNEEVPYGLRRLEEGLRNNILPYWPNQKIELEKFGKDLEFEYEGFAYSALFRVMGESLGSSGPGSEEGEGYRAFEIAISWCKRDNKRFDERVVGTVRTKMEERLGKREIRKEGREERKNKWRPEVPPCWHLARSRSILPGCLIAWRVSPWFRIWWATQATRITAAAEGTGGTTTATTTTTAKDTGAAGEDGTRRTTAGERSWGGDRQREREDIYENVPPGREEEI
ncbi:hypothetical protein WMY93_015204 [Mugilogobius chulae]|uniref:Uncharacterized protein n=1 Tax=Mugilogobius chulae TaxID=88201 RepID=A0AAW0P8U5_9GOBI